MPADHAAAIQSPEDFSVEGNQLVRTLQRRDGTDVRTVVQRVLSSPESSTLADLSAEWDKSFLSERQLSPWPATRGHVVMVDLFCGIGGMSLGVREACRALGFGFEVARAFDLDEEALATYNANFGARTGDSLDLGGISSMLGSTKTPAEVALVRAVDCEPDLLVAGPPCQGHSNLNNHTRRADPKNELYFKVVRAVELLNPKCVVIENVPTVTRDLKQVVPRAVEALRRLGYSVDHGVVDLQKLGVAQTRKRHVLIAKRLASPSEAREDGPYADGELVRAISGAYSRSPRDARWAMGDLLLTANSGLFIDSLPEIGAVTKERIEYLFTNDLFDLPDTERPDCHRDGTHTYQSVYGRMRWDRPAPTVTSGFFTMGRGRYIHPERRSVLTAHEASRLQFFPDSFDWSEFGTRRGLATAIGNAVPPKLSYVLAAELIR